MCNRKLFKELKKFLEIIDGFENLNVYHTSIKENIETLYNMEITKLDFDDCLHYTIAKKLNAKIITFDKHFNNIQDVEILHP